MFTKRGNSQQKKIAHYSSVLSFETGKVTASI